MTDQLNKLIKQAGMELQPRKEYDRGAYPGHIVSDKEHLDNNLSAVRTFFDGGLKEFARLLIEETLTQVDERCYGRSENQWYYEDDKKWIRMHFLGGKLL